MLQRYFCLSLVLSLLALSRLLLPAPRAPIIDAGLIESAAKSADAETAFALGRKIFFSRPSLDEIQLIPGISDRLAFRILDNHQEIRAAAQKLPRGQKHRAFELVHGIGPKTAQKLGEFWQFEGEDEFSPK